MIKKFIHFRRHPARDWYYTAHGIKIKSDLILPVESHELSSGTLSLKSIFSRCIR